MEVSTEGGHVLICENEVAGVINKTLLIKLFDESALVGFHLPPMRHIFNTVSNGVVVISLLHEPLRKYFDSFLDTLISELQSTDTSGKLLDRIFIAFSNLKKLVQLEPMLSHEECKGIYGELLFILRCIDKKMEPIVVVEAWQGPDRTSHDFVFNDEAFEIKSVSRTTNKIAISSEHQLEALPGKPLMLVVNKIETVRNTNTDSLGQLYREVIKRLNNDNAIKLFREKCEVIGSGYYGPESVTYHYRFNIIETVFYDVNQNTFPRLSHSNLLPGLSNVSYSIDLSIINEYKVVI